MHKPVDNVDNLKGACKYKLLCMWIKILNFVNEMNRYKEEIICQEAVRQFLQHLLRPL